MKKNVICCLGMFKLIPKLKWYNMADKWVSLPCFPDTNIRINFCPSCGKEIRTILLTKKDFVFVLTNQSNKEVLKTFQ